MNASRNDKPSFEDIASELGPQLRRYLERMTGNPTDADDLVQETLIRIAKGLVDFEGRSQPKTWAFRIASRVAADHFRRSGPPGAIVEFAESEACEDRRELDEEFVVDEMNACVRSFIDSLPADYRAAIVLHDLQGLTAEETALACDCSLATAKIRIHRARKRLQSALEKECVFYHDQDQVLRCDRKGKGDPDA